MANTPAVSVVIPMFNAEKYIGECLESLLAQTFADFEVIVVDDCSTDSSVAIIEQYRRRFGGGQLTLSRMEKNSGGGAFPRNKGLKLSRGEYIFFADADDLLTLTALEELYTLAKDFDAEVVYCEKYYRATNDLGKIFLQSDQPSGLVERPTLETENFAERVNRIQQYFFPVMPWLKLVRRDLLIEHEIFFPNIVREDDVWTWNLVLHAKKFLRVPNAVYVWRNVGNSFTRSDKTPEQKINFWLNPVILGVKTLDEVLSRIEFFRQNPQHRYELLKYFVEVSFMFTREHTAKKSPFEVYDAIRQKFSDALGEQDVLVPLLCSLITAQQNRIAELERTLEEKFS